MDPLSYDITNNFEKKNAFVSGAFYALQNVIQQQGEKTRHVMHGVVGCLAEKQQNQKNGNIAQSRTDVTINV